jgi:hypothetical protein
MMMQAARKLSLCFASVLAFGLIAGTAEAKRAEYEINGIAYTYSTKNRAQVELARRRIEAANRAAEIKARASAEAVSNPLVRLFGSRTQAEVPAAEAELQKVLAEREPSRAEAYAVERQVRRELRVERRRIALESRARKRQQVARKASSGPVVSTARESRTALPRSRSPEPVITTAQVTRSSRPDRPRPAEPVVTSVSAERTGGLDTTSTTAEAVRAEPVDREAYMMSFVEQLRRKTSSDPISRRLREP